MRPPFYIRYTLVVAHHRLLYSRHLWSLWGISTLLKGTAVISVKHLSIQSSKCFQSIQFHKCFAVDGQLHAFVALSVGFYTAVFLFFIQVCFSYHKAITAPLAQLQRWFYIKQLLAKAQQYLFEASRRPTLEFSKFSWSTRLDKAVIWNCSQNSYQDNHLSPIFWAVDKQLKSL